MKYRKFGRLDWSASVLGFGCMRLPTNDGNPMSGNINEKETIKMIHYSIDNGINYFDTAFVYHGGMSEIVAGKALKDGYRKKIKLATKCPVWSIRKPEDFERILNEQLKKLQTENIDFYLFHGLNEWNWNIVLKHNLIEKAESAIKDGKISYLGFSFHDEYPLFKKIIDGYHGWTFCQIQYNYMDIEHQAGRKGLEYAYSKGLAVIVMEPLLGGRLSTPPKEMREIFNSYDKNSTPAEWSLRWIWNHQEVSLILSGMSKINQVEENILSADKSDINSLSEPDMKFIEKIHDKYLDRYPIPCTKCGYCMPCPSGVNIPRNFEIYNDGIAHDDMKGGS